MQPNITSCPAVASEAAPTPPKRKRGRPRKVNPTEKPVEQAESSAPIYKVSEWYLCPAPKNDDAEFERLLAEKRKFYASPEFNEEILVYENEQVRIAVDPPCGRWGFTPDGLSQYANAIRGPYTHDSSLTLGGEIKARILLRRERMLAGQIDYQRKPDIAKLRDYLPPLLLELMERD